MESVSSNLFVIGLLLLLGFIAHTLGKRTHVPRLTLLLLLGILSGPYVFNLFPETISKWFSLIAHMSLAMVGFLLGERFYGKDIKSTKLTIIKISIAQSLIVSILVFVLLFISGVDIIISLLLAGIAPATDPAATYDVIKEYKAKGSLSDVLLGIVSLDDA
ncbi:MAG: sodium:proton exchanger, partial [Candidatus Dadabacteria bacterium]|nr:sodium:proton exchanger [Candidatus Dadabacteria bacterium]